MHSDALGCTRMHSDALRVDGSPGEKVGGSLREYRRRLTRSRRCVRTINADSEFIESRVDDTHRRTVVQTGLRRRRRLVVQRAPNGEVTPPGLTDDLGVIIT